MNTRANLKVVFDKCASKGILTSLNESCCNTCNSAELEMELEKAENKDYIGYVYAHAQTVDQMMEDLGEEGSATVFWGFGGRTVEDQNTVGHTLASVFQEGGYYVEWDESMSSKVAAVIEEADLPEGFVKKWHKEQEALSDDSYNPEIMSFEAYADPVRYEIREVSAGTDADDELDISDVENDLSDEEERVDPDAEVVFDNEKKEERLFSSEEELPSSEDDEDESGGPIVDLSSEEDETLCPPDCDCVNCEAEREEGT